MTTKARTGRTTRLEVTNDDSPAGFTLVAELYNLQNNMNAAQEDATHFQSDVGFKDFIPGDKSVTRQIEGNLIKDDAGQSLLEQIFESGETRTWKVTYPGPGGRVATFLAMVTDFNESIQASTKTTFTATLTQSGNQIIQP